MIDSGAAGAFLRTLLGVCCPLLVLSACDQSGPGSAPVFSRHPVARTYHLFDLGVADINGDGLIDIYTTNHSARQSVLLNQGGVRFADRLVASGLSQDLQFPGVDPSAEEPALARPGLYIYWYKSFLIIRSHELPQPADLSGVLRIQRAALLHADGAISLQPVPRASNKRTLGVRFQVRGDGQLTVGSESFFLRARFDFGKAAPLEQIFVGTGAVNPERRHFALGLRDRHAMAWADVDGDGDLDVFVSRGGGSGRMPKHGRGAADELFVQDGGRFENRIAERRILKQGCPGRRAAWTDVDGDARLDLYVVCGRGKPPRQHYPNQLYVQAANGRFSEQAGTRGIDIRGDGAALWLDVNADGRDDLLWADRRNFWLYENTGGAFTRRHAGSHRGAITQLSAADYDGDGDLDVFAAARSNSLLLQNENGAFRITSARAAGLPRRAVCANWVDVDNDGLIDLHVLPDGVYRQQPQGRFRRTGWLSGRAVGESGAAFCTWFDVDNDGSRDLLLARREREAGADERYADLFGGRGHLFRLSQWRVDVYRNQGAGNHWLQLVLDGPPGNRSAVATRIEVVTPAARRVRFVGHAEGALRSQGHYRVYVGLGRDRLVDLVKVHWPDGRVDSIGDVAADQVLRISWREPAAMR